MNEDTPLQQSQPSLIENISKYLPSVSKPLYKQNFNTRLKWTGIALILYVVLANITVVGIAKGAAFEQFKFFEIVLGSRFGSIMTLGIGPIVTAGIILQLLVGSKIINWDMSKPGSKKKFQSWNKFLAITFSFVEAIAYVMAGALPTEPNFVSMVAVILQLAMGGLIVILLDEIVSKWGFGSGISLFIAAGVGSQVLVRIFSPLTVGCEAFKFALCIPSEGSPPAGLLWNVMIGLSAGKVLESVYNILPIISTVFIFLIVVYVQHIRVDVPLAFSALRGFGKNWSLKLLYTSNVPVILTAALLANVQLIARMGLQPDPATGLMCSFLGCFDADQNPVSGLIYYLSVNSRGFFFDLLAGNFVLNELLRAVTYVSFLAIFSMIFSIFWVSTSSMDAKSVANQIEGAGMQIPGYRRDPRIVESVLNRYIPALSVLGGITVGLLAGTADLLGAIGTGTGMLLTVMIIYNYYEELSNQNMDEAHPIIKKLFGV